MSTLHLNGQSYSFESIKQQGVLLLNESERIHQSSIQLIQDWFSNKQTFAFTTSGSTGVPKAIELNREQLEASAKGTIEALKLTTDDHFLVCMNTAFIGGAMLLVRALLVNAPITLMEPSGNPLQLLPENHPYTFASFAPLQLFPILQNAHSEKLKINRFKHVLVGGGAIDSVLEKELIALDVKVYHTYGMTETVSHVALKELGKQHFFVPLPGVELRTDERHCMAIRSAATNQTWIQTNDVVDLQENHSFTVLGRADDVVNSGGIKIWPATVEQAILEVLGQAVSNVLVSGIADAKLGQRLIALIETRDTPSVETLHTNLAAKLAKYETPRQYFFLPTFSYTPTGKINKAETLKMIGL